MSCVLRAFARILFHLFGGAFPGGARDFGVRAERPHRDGHRERAGSHGGMYGVGIQRAYHENNTVGVHTALKRLCITLSCVLIGANLEAFCE